MGTEERVAGVACEAAALEEAEKRYWREIWRTGVYDAVSERRIDLARFGPVQAAIIAEEFEAPALNVVLGAEAPGALEAGHLADAVEWVRSHGIDHRIPLIPGEPTPSAAERWLRRRGYARDEGGAAKFVRDTSPPAFAAPAGVEIVEFDDSHPELDLACETFADLMRAGLGDGWPVTFFWGLQERLDWRAFVATDARTEHSLSCTLMLVHDGVAELGPAAPMEAEVPGCGDCQVALLRHCILEAAAAGCRLIAAEAEEPGPGGSSASHENLREAGFERAYVRHDWLPPREAIVAERKRRIPWAA